MDEKAGPEDLPKSPPPYGGGGGGGGCDGGPPAYNRYAPAAHQPPAYQNDSQPPAYQPDARPPAYPAAAYAPQPFASPPCPPPGYAADAGAGGTYHLPGQVIILEEFQRRRQSPQDYLSWSLVTLMCLFWPLGIVALMYSIKVREALMAGDELAAARHSATCRNLNIAGTVMGIATLALIVLIVPIVFVANPYRWHYPSFP